MDQEIMTHKFRRNLRSPSPSFNRLFFLLTRLFLSKNFFQQFLINVCGDFLPELQQMRTESVVDELETFVIFEGFCVPNVQNLLWLSSLVPIVPASWQGPQ